MWRGGFSMLVKAEKFPFSMTRGEGRATDGTKNDYSRLDSSQKTSEGKSHSNGPFRSFLLIRISLLGFTHSTAFNPPAICISSVFFPQILDVEAEGKLKREKI
jgi:hypothetical protein